MERGLVRMQRHHTQTATHTQTNRCARQPTHPKHFKKHYETPDSCSWLVKKNEEGTICSSKHTAGYGNNSLSQHTCAQLSACRNRQVTEIKINYKDNPKWIPLLRHWKSFDTSGLCWSLQWQCVDANYVSPRLTFLFDNFLSFPIICLKGLYFVLIWDLFWAGIRDYIMWCISKFLILTFYSYIY